MDFKKGLQKIIQILDEEQLPYMIVGGFALSYYNRFRFTADIDCVLQMHPHHIEKIVNYFPDWVPFLDAFKEQASRGLLFNITDFSSGVKYDFMLYQDSDYNWTAFERRKHVDFMDVKCYISSPEDLIISKLIWYGASKSAKQLEDIKFLLQEVSLNRAYLDLWISRLTIPRYGIF